MASSSRSVAPAPTSAQWRVRSRSEEHKAGTDAHRWSHGHSVCGSSKAEPPYVSQSQAEAVRAVPVTDLAVEGGGVLVRGSSVAAGPFLQADATHCAWCAPGLPCARFVWCCRVRTPLWSDAFWCTVDHRADIEPALTGVLCVRPRADGGHCCGWAASGSNHWSPRTRQDARIRPAARAPTFGSSTWRSS